MAFVQIADVYEPLTFNAAMQEKAIELNRFIASGILVDDPSLTAQAATGGRIGELPFYNFLSTATEPDIMTDDPLDTATPAKVDSNKMIWRLAALHYSWSTMNLARDLALQDPMGAITSRIGGWWATQNEKRLIASCNGILADNVANDSGDMVNTIYSDIASPLAANIISAEAVLDALQTAGDHKDMFTTIVVHSVTHTTMQKQNLIDYIPDAQGATTIPYYLGMRLIVDDSMTITSGTNSPQYTTIMFSPAAFSLGYGRLLVPSEVEREPNVGNGSGQDILHTRESVIIHPYGFQFVSASITNESATLAELADATEWDRVVDRKHVGIAFLLHNN